MTQSFREMTAADLPAVFELRVSTIENAISLEELEKDYGITPESLAEAMKSDVRGWLCEADGRVVGFSMGDRSNGEVQVVAVLPGYERKGIGKGVLQRVQDWLYESGHEEVWLYANRDPNVRATGYYRNLGWQKTGKTRGEDEVLTRRKARSGTGPLG